MKRYKAIFIDWDDTIGDFQGSAQDAQRDIYETYHLQELWPTYQDYYNDYHAHNIVLWEQYGQRQVTKEYLQRDRFLYPICTRMGMPVPAHDGIQPGGPLISLADRMGQDFLTLTNKYFRLLPGTKELVEYLSQKYPLTVVSNGFVEVQYYKLEHSGLRDCFQDIVLSEEAGIQKPQPGIFDIALQHAGLEADEVLMIGDSYQSDIMGAKAAGIDQLWICNNTPTSEQTATYIVHSLAEIYDIV